MLLASSLSRIRLLSLAAALAVGTACQSDRRPMLSGGGTSLGSVEVPELRELSGLAASRRHPGFLWAVNDDGPMHLYLLDSTGRLHARYQLSDKSLTDWEAVAVLPHPTDPARDRIAIGDIGDNRRKRKAVRLFLLPEPVPPTFASDSLRPVAYETLLLYYPKEARDAEALLPDAETGDLYLLGKQRKRTQLFRIPARQLHAGETELQQVGEIEGVFLATEAATHPSGRYVLVRTDATVYYWPRTRGQPIHDLLTGTPPSVLLHHYDEYGEAMTWTPWRPGLLLSGEGNDGFPPALRWYAVPSWN